MPIDVPAAVRTALRLLEQDGLDKLTVRRLADELGVKAPALYWHFSSKRALLDHMTGAIVEPVLNQLPDKTTPWLEWLEKAGNALHTALLGHRDGPSIAIGADLSVARSLGEFAERAVEVLHRAGFPLADATRAAGVFVHFVLGRAVEDQTRPDESMEIPFPLMAQGLRARQAAGATPADDFRYALGVVLAGLNATRPTAP